MLIIPLLLFMISFVHCPFSSSTKMVHWVENSLIFFWLAFIFFYFLFLSTESSFYLERKAALERAIWAQGCKTLSSSLSSVTNLQQIPRSLGLGVLIFKMRDLHLVLIHSFIHFFLNKYFYGSICPATYCGSREKQKMTEVSARWSFVKQPHKQLQDHNYDHCYKGDYTMCESLQSRFGHRKVRGSCPGRRDA